MDSTGFYAKAGYVPVGDKWNKLGGTCSVMSLLIGGCSCSVVHQKMVHSLR